MQCNVSGNMTETRTTLLHGLDYVLHCQVGPPISSCADDSPRPFIDLHRISVPLCCAPWMSGYRPLLLDAPWPVCLSALHPPRLRPGFSHAAHSPTAPSPPRRWRPPVLIRNCNGCSDPLPSRHAASHHALRQILNFVLTFPYVPSSYAYLLNLFVPKPISFCRMM